MLDDDPVVSSTDNVGLSGGVALGGGAEVEGAAICEIDGLAPVPTGTTCRSMSLSTSMAADIDGIKRRTIHTGDARRDISRFAVCCGLMAVIRSGLQGCIMHEGIKTKEESA